MASPISWREARRRFRGGIPGNDGALPFRPGKFQDHKSMPAGDPHFDEDRNDQDGEDVHDFDHRADRWAGGVPPEVSAAFLAALET